MVELAGRLVSEWGEGDLPKGQPKATWYDKYGRARVLPADPYSLAHYQSRGLRLDPPESPVPVPVDNGFGEGSANATRQKSSPKPEVEQPDIQVLLDRIAALEAARKRGPDKKKRKKRKRNRA